MSLKTLKRDFSQLQSDLKGIFRLTRGLPGFFRKTINPQEAEETIKRELETREERFLKLVLTRIYERPSSPYLKLLKMVGCEFSDLHMQVARYGIEETLQRLAQEGVYFTSEEFKGKKEVIRGRQSFSVAPSHFENPVASRGYWSQSSGTVNEPVRSFVSLDLLAARTPVTCLFFAAHDLFSRAHAMYDAVLPGAAGVNNLLIYARIGVRTDRWVARKIPTDGKLDGIYHYLTTQILVLAARHSSPGFPRPEFIENSEIDRIVTWLAAMQRQKKACCITTAASNAVRIARVASDLGISLEGVKFIVTGEPFTESKRQIIEKAGAKGATRYAYGGSVNIGFGCSNPLQTDEIHVNQHLLALLPNPRSDEAGRSCIHPLLCTTLDPSFPRLLLNVENGDYGCLTQRDCGCALEKVGLTLHLHHIRSHEKFTSEGMNYFYGDLYQLFEKTFPAEFGGGPGDYQLVEEEDGNGQTRLTLVIHPEAGDLDESRALTRLRLALSDGSRGNRFMTGVWQNAGTFRVRREVPYASPRGKILPLRISQSKQPPA